MKNEVRMTKFETKTRLSRVARSPSICFGHSNFVIHSTASNFVLRIYTRQVSFATLPAMRIIAGEFRGRKLLGPESEVTRPITDRVKQSLFDILTPYLAEARVYDCFAGTGSMGLECLSRGATHVTFFEADRSAANRLKKNIDTLKMADATHIIGGDLFKWFGSAKGKHEIDLIFLDPPYRFLKERADDLQNLARAMSKHLKPDGIVVFRHDSEDSLLFPQLPVADTRSYGSMTLEFLRPADNKPPTTD